MSRYNINARAFVRNNAITGQQIEHIAEHGLDSDYANYLIWEARTDQSPYNGLTPEQVQRHCQWLEMVESAQVLWDNYPGDAGWVLRYYNCTANVWSDVPLDGTDYEEAVKEAATYLADDADPEWVQKGLSLKLA